MAREKEAYRDVLARLYVLFPDCGCITMGQAAQYLGVSERTIRRSQTIPKLKDMGAVRIPLEPFARWICRAKEGAV